jgi:hypothetical protein
LPNKRFCRVSTLEVIIIIIIIIIIIAQVVTSLSRPLPTVIVISTGSRRAQ